MNAITDFARAALARLWVARGMGETLRRVALGAGAAALALALAGGPAQVVESETTGGPALTGAMGTPVATQTRDLWASAGLSVNGTQIVDASGRTVTLVGAARFSLEYSCRGDGHFGVMDFEAMRAWGMNTVRIPLSSAFWRNLDNQCPAYQKTVRAAVANAEEVGLYVILDLQRDAPFSLPQDAIKGGAQCPLPDATHDLRFWQDLAGIYKNDPHVLFDIFGEPYQVGWNQWRQGGPITSDCYAYAAAQTYTAMGMPALAAAVRAVAPRNIIIMSGIDWGYDLSGLGPGHATAISNVLYGTHPWDHTSVQQPWDWDRAFGTTARTLPVIATEFGAYDCQTDYIATEIAYFERLHMSFLAWSWEPGGCQIPALIANWSGTPTSPYGAFIQEQMLRATAGNRPPRRGQAPAG